MFKLFFGVVFLWLFYQVFACGGMPDGNLVSWGIVANIGIWGLVLFLKGIIDVFKIKPNDNSVIKDPLNR